MLNPRRFLLALCLMSLSGLAAADDNVLQFSTELLLHEGKQFRQAEPFKYSDPEHGPALRALLSPARAAVVVNEYFEGIPQGIARSDISEQFVPLANRYKQAFMIRPRKFEEEYLDALGWMVLFMNAQRRFHHTIEQNMSQAAKLTQEDAAFRLSVKTFRRLSDAMETAMATDLATQAAQGIFSPAASGRALALAQRITLGLAEAPPTGEPSRPGIAYTAMNEGQRTAFGERRYRENCLACHGVTGAGVPGTFPALAGSAKLGNADKAIQIIMNGVPGTVMGGFAHLDDDELAAIVTYTRARFGGLQEQAVAPTDIRASRDMPAARKPSEPVSDSKAPPR